MVENFLNWLYCPWKLILACCLSMGFFAFVLLFWYIDIDTKYFMSSPTLENNIHLQRILYEASSIIGIAVAIVMGGITVAIPLYLFLWQSITDSMFQVFLAVREHYLLAKNKGAMEAAGELEDLMHKTYHEMEYMNEKMPFIRQIFGYSMILSVFMLLTIVMVLIFPEEVISYIAATVCSIGSMFLAAMFLYLVFRVWKMKSVRNKFNNQVKLACIINNISNDECL